MRSSIAGNVSCVPRSSERFRVKRDARRRQCIGHVSYVLTSVGIRDLWEVANQPQLTTRERDSLRLVLAEIESSRAERRWTTGPQR